MTLPQPSRNARSLDQEKSRAAPEERQGRPDNNSDVGYGDPLPDGASHAPVWCCSPSQGETGPMSRIRQGGPGCSA
jgi:hypothetical protein